MAFNLNRPDATFTSRTGSFRPGRPGPVRFVVIHHAAGVNATFAGIHNTLQRNGLSTHAAVRDGQWARMVADRDTAFTTGSAQGNGFGLAVEISNAGGEPDWRISEASFETAAQLTAAWCRAHNLGRPNASNVRYHRQFVATRCPGEWMRANFPRFIARAAAIYGGSPAPTPAPTKPPGTVIRPGVPAPPFPLPAGSFFGPEGGPRQSVSGWHSHRDDLRRWQQRMRDRGWGITVDGLYGPKGAKTPTGNTASVALAFQREKGLRADALIGPETWAAAWTEPITA